MSGAIPGLNIPGLGKTGTRGAATGPKPDLLIDEMDPGDSRPSILLVGNSGTGKTEQIARMMRAGKRALVLDVENKAQVLATYRPLRIKIGEAEKQPDGSIRMTDATARYDRLMRFRDGLREGKYREHNGKPIDFVGIDGLMEIGSVIKTHKMKNVPTSKTGEANTFRAFDEIGMEIIDFVVACKEAASDASKAFGIPPIGIVATCGEFYKDGELRPLLPGNQAHLHLKYHFELVLRLDVEFDGTALRYIAHTVPGEVFTPMPARWYAKAPGGLFEPRITDPDLGAIYDKMVENYNRKES